MCRAKYIGIKANRFVYSQFSTTSNVISQLKQLNVGGIFRDRHSKSAA
jgi:hypothetical protein